MEKFASGKTRAGPEFKPRAEKKTGDNLLSQKTQ